ncbi:MAG: ribosome-associated translation inhibitor RaiA [Planctomycetes bacterium]|nr:ribosome-associated translation inhibitor RaiA [Planctomycetota bacterium]
MQIRVTARHVEVSNDVREYIYEKASKLPRYYDRIHEIEVILDHESEQFSAEMIVRVEREPTIVASETGPDTFALIDVIVGRLERQLKKLKDKRRNHKHGAKNIAAEEKPSE